MSRVARTLSGSGTAALLVCFAVGCAVHTQHPREVRSAPEQYERPVEEAPGAEPRSPRFPLYAADEVGQAMRGQHGNGW